MTETNLSAPHVAIDFTDQLTPAGLAWRAGFTEQEARTYRRALHAAQQAGGSSEVFVRTLLAQVQGHQPIHHDALKAMEHGFLMSNQLTQRAWTRDQDRDLFLDTFRQRLTFAGSDVVPANWSHFGWIGDDPDFPLALSRDSGHVILVSGAQNAGKTVLGSVLCEGTLCPGEPTASSPLLPGAYVFFHLEEHDRLPQLLDALKPNPVAADIQLLADRLGVGPLGLTRLRLAIPQTLYTAQIYRRLQPYIDLGLEVVPIKFHLGQLGQPGLEALLGAEDGTKVVRRLLDQTQNQGEEVTIAGLHRFLETAGGLIAQQRGTAHARLDSFEEFESQAGGPGLWQLFQPGWATVVFLGGPHMGRSKVAPLVVALMNGLLQPSPEHGAFQRFIVVDEMNLLCEDDLAWKAFIRTARLVRHRGSILMLMGQDLLCVPPELFGLAGIVGIMAQRSPQLWEHARDRVGALRGHRYQEVAGLRPGEMLLAVSLTTDPRWQHGAKVVRVRPLRFMHGGFTRAMV